MTLHLPPMLHCGSRITNLGQHEPEFDRAVGLETNPIESSAPSFKKLAVYLALQTRHPNLSKGNRPLESSYPVAKVRGPLTSTSRAAHSLVAPSMCRERLKRFKYAALFMVDEE